MILTGKEIIKEFKDGKIKIEDFKEENINSNSYDIHLGNKILKYNSEVLDTKINNEYTIIDIPEDGYLLKQGEFVLASSKEKFGSEYYTPMVHNKSGVARLGLFIHITADLIDIGLYENFTFQFFATLPMKIYPNMKIGQVSFWQPKGDIDIYKGIVNNSNLPKSSGTYLEF